ncbi:MAG: tetratricopeptide repeat protein, partial [Terriglobales bacterium]
MRRRYWFTNRVVWGLLLFLVAVGFWEFHFKPQYRPFYEEGVKQYQAGNFPRAIDQFQRAYTIAPNSTDVLLMMGWSNLKLHRFEEARFYFERTLAIDPRVTEARIGDSFVVLETGRGTLDVQAMATVLKDRPNDANMQIIA